jgi:L-cystine uptake protein TcyP (sodium:dicarboxylate symporter family)
MPRKHLSLHARILIALVLGAAAGVAVNLGLGEHRLLHKVIS